MSGGRRASEAFVGDRHFTVVPSDTVNFTDPDTVPAIPGGDATHINAAVTVLDDGPVDVSLVDTHGTTVIWSNVKGPWTIPLKAVRVNVADTTATNMIAVW